MAYMGMPTEHSRGLHCHDIYVYVNRALKGVKDRKLASGKLSRALKHNSVKYTADKKDHW